MIPPHPTVKICINYKDIELFEHLIAGVTNSSGPKGKWVIFLIGPKFYLIGQLNFLVKPQVTYFNV